MHTGWLQRATNCCPLTKPFLQAFWQWKSAVKSSGKPNKLLRGFAHLLHCLFEKDYNHPTPYAPQSSWWGASDASASDSGEAYVGGWISNQPNPEKHQVWWFHYQVKADQHPWAFKDRKPKRRIAALEMLGTLFLTMYLCKKSSSLRGPWPVITRAMSTGCWMTTRERCPQLACSWRSCSNSRLRVVVWCHPTWRETTTNGRMTSLTLLLKGLTLRWNLWLHHYFRSSRSSRGYYNILMHKVIFLDRSQSSLPLLLRRKRRGGNASTGFGWSYSPRTLSWERYFSLILTLPTCGLRTGDLVGLCQLLALLVRLDFWSTWQGPFWIWPRNLWALFDTCQQARVAQTGTQTQKEKVLLLLLLGCCLSVSSVGLFSWLADIL